MQKDTRTLESLINKDLYCKFIPELECEANLRTSTPPPAQGQ